MLNKKTKKQSIITYDDAEEQSLREEMYGLLEKCPIPPDQVLSNLGLFLNSKNLSRILFMNHIYQ